MVLHFYALLRFTLNCLQEFWLFFSFHYYLLLPFSWLQMQTVIIGVNDEMQFIECMIWGQLWNAVHYLFLVADQVSCIYWLLHSDLHEVRVTSSVEYISSMVANVEPLNQSASGQRWDLENIFMLKQNFGKGKLNVRFKRRNGRVRMMVTLSLPLSVHSINCTAKCFNIFLFVLLLVWRISYWAVRNQFYTCFTWRWNYISGPFAKGQ